MMAIRPKPGYPLNNNFLLQAYDHNLFRNLLDRVMRMRYGWLSGATHPFTSYE